MEFIPYCAEEAFQFCFYQIPKELFTNEYYKGKLSSDAILLYALLLDRLSISRKRGRIDENGHIGFRCKYSYCAHYFSIY